MQVDEDNSPRFDAELARYAWHSGLNAGENMVISILVREDHRKKVGVQYMRVGGPQNASNPSRLVCTANCTTNSQKNDNPFN